MPTIWKSACFAKSAFKTKNRALILENFALTCVHMSVKIRWSLLRAVCCKLVARGDPIPQDWIDYLGYIQASVHTGRFVDRACFIYIYGLIQVFNACFGRVQIFGEIRWRWWFINKAVCRRVLAKPSRLARYFDNHELW